jgi:hypothetical protein
MKKILIGATVLATALATTTFAQAAPKKPTARQAYAQVIDPAATLYNGYPGYCEYRTYWGECVYGSYYAYGLYPLGVWTGPWYWQGPNPRYDYSKGEYN